VRALRVWAAFAVALLLAGPAAAHIGLRYPPSRYGDSILKEGPCGLAGGARSQNVTELQSGASVEVTWDEYVNHPGHFRISFDPDGDDDFADPVCLSGCDTRTPEFELYSNASVLLDGIADTPSGGLSSAVVTLPDIECDRCTLQVIQVMYDKPPYTSPGNDIYYQCADLVLRRSAAPTPTCAPGEMGCGAACAGDCDGNGSVGVNDLIAIVNVALGTADVSSCPAGDADGNGSIRLDEIIPAVQHSLIGCAAIPSGSSVGR
jgi:Copper acquisition factor BIM1-like